jgi:hypothetical protein
MIRRKILLAGKKVEVVSPVVLFNNPTAATTKKAQSQD